MSHSSVTSPRDLSTAAEGCAGQQAAARSRIVNLSGSALAE
jgi:hypothetical protein